MDRSEEHVPVLVPDILNGPFGRKCTSISSRSLRWTFVRHFLELFLRNVLFLRKKAPVGTHHISTGFVFRKHVFSEKNKKSLRAHTTVDQGF